MFGSVSYLLFTRLFVQIRHEVITKLILILYIVAQ